MNPGFKFDAISFENDLALLELTDPVQYEVNVIPACLPGQAADHLVGQRGWVTGWGITRVGGSLSPVLQELTSSLHTSPDQSRPVERRLQAIVFGRASLTYTLPFM